MKAFVTSMSARGGGGSGSQRKDRRKRVAALCAFALAATTVVSFRLLPASARSKHESQLDSISSQTNVPQWSYEGPVGPQYWGALGFPICGTGKKQSPINVSTQDTDAAKGSVNDLLRFSSVPSRFEVQIKNNSPHLICKEDEKSSCGDMFINNQRYKLIQFHFHNPAENTVNGERGDLELHLVHQNPETGKIAVVGVIYRATKTPTSSQGVTAANLLANQMQKDYSMTKMNSRDLLHDKPEGYYRWSGSLTTPPCTEEIDWYLIDTIYEVPEEAVSALLRQTKTPNARPIQALHGRTVTHYTPPN